jgi:uncharacterized protein (DUF736 family)
MKQGGHSVTRAQFEENLNAKLDDPQFNADITALLAEGYEWDADKAAEVVQSELLQRIP